MGANNFNPLDARMDMDVPVILYLHDRIASGHTVNVSDSGMLATFDRRLDPWATGRLCVVTEKSHLSIQVRIVRVDGSLAGMSFVSDSDHADIQQLIEHANGGPAAAPRAPAA
jgi:hypothetical protein